MEYKKICSAQHQLLINYVDWLSNVSNYKFIVLPNRQIDHYPQHLGTFVMSKIKPDELFEVRTIQEEINSVNKVIYDGEYSKLSSDYLNSVRRGWVSLFSNHRTFIDYLNDIMKLRLENWIYQHKHGHKP